MDSTAVSSPIPSHSSWNPYSSSNSSVSAHYYQQAPQPRRLSTTRPYLHYGQVGLAPLPRLDSTNPSAKHMLASRDAPETAITLPPMSQEGAHSSSEDNGTPPPDVSMRYRRNAVSAEASSTSDPSWHPIARHEIERDRASGSVSPTSPAHNLSHLSHHSEQHGAGAGASSYNDNTYTYDTASRGPGPSRPWDQSHRHTLQPPSSYPDPHGYDDRSMHPHMPRSPMGDDGPRSVPPTSSYFPVAPMQNSGGNSLGFHPRVEQYPRPQLSSGHASFMSDGMDRGMPAVLYPVSGTGGSYLHHSRSDDGSGHSSVASDTILHSPSVHSPPLHSPHMGGQSSLGKNSPAQRGRNPPGSGRNTPGRDPNAPKRGKLPKETTAMLRKWILEHSDNPYPSEDEKKQLAEMGNLTRNQINDWFINARRRYLGANANSRGVQGR